MQKCFNTERLIHRQIISDVNDYAQTDHAIGKLQSVHKNGCG